MASLERLQQIRKHIVNSGSIRNDPTRLDGQVVLITGAAQGQISLSDLVCEAYHKTGIGRATADLLARQGAKIAINDLDKIKAESAVDELTAAGHEAFYLVGDMLDETFPSKLVQAVIARFGKINCLINNAGMLSRLQVRIKLFCMSLI
jgi:3-oxoacyl-[acyl-carrier protein] reductase